MTEKTKVRIQVIRVYEIEVDTPENEAVQAAYCWNSKCIEKHGKLLSVETDYAELTANCHDRGTIDKLTYQHPTRRKPYYLP